MKRFQKESLCSNIPSIVEFQLKIPSLKLTLKAPKRLMDEQRPSGYHVIFVTNNYHLFPTSLYAKQVGLNA